MSIADISQLSALASRIYDCALDPDGWPVTLEMIREFRDARVTGVTIVDPVAKHFRSSFSIGLTDEAEQALSQTYAAMLPAPLFDSSNMVVDEVYCVADKMERRDFERSRFFREWAEPNGILDSPSSCLMKSPSRFAMATCMISRAASERDKQLGRLLAPHIRKAVTISDLLNSRRIGIEHLEAALDALSIGVVITDDQANIQFANYVAEAMLVAANPIQSSGGVLKTHSATATKSLWGSIGKMAREETATEIVGIGIPASDNARGELIALHLLPLERRSGGSLTGRRRVAVFISPERAAPETAVEIIGMVYGLTQAECRVLKRLGQGEICEDIARSADVAVSTIRTHVTRLLAKTGVRRQAGLVRLVEQFSLPIRQQPSVSETIIAASRPTEMFRS